MIESLVAMIIIVSVFCIVCLAGLAYGIYNLIF